MKKILSLFFALTLSVMASNVYTKTYNQPLDEVYSKLLKAMDNAHLVVVSEIDILQKFKNRGLPKKFGKNFNTNKLTGIKAIVACNGWFGNEVANHDPDMMAFCPIRVTVVEKGNKTTVTYVKATSASTDSKAYPVLEKLTKKVINVIGNL